MTIALTYLAPLFGLQSDVVPTKLDPVEVREQTVSVVSRLLSGVARQRPLVLICEDLHWVDDTTAKVIARICLEIGRLRALMIVTTRPTSDEPRLDLSNFIEIALQPFDRSTAADLIRSVAKGVEVPDETIQRIVDRCEGVPLILEQVTHTTLEGESRAHRVRL